MEKQNGQGGRSRRQKKRRSRPGRGILAAGLAIFLLGGAGVLAAGGQRNWKSSARFGITQAAEQRASGENQEALAVWSQAAKEIAAKAGVQDGDLVTVGESGVVPDPVLGGGELVMYPSCTEGQMMSFLLETKEGSLVVIDGGRWEDGDALMEDIRARGGRVSAWFLTHAHTDHVGALLKLLTQESEGTDTGITIDRIYYNFASMDWYTTHELGDLGTAASILTQLSLLPEKERQTVGKGDRVQVDDVQIEVMNDRYEPEQVGERDGNDASVAYRLTVNGVSILFLGDLQKAGGAHLLEQCGESLKSDMVQVAHHGQNGVNEDVYQAIAPQVCLWPAPQWLWDNQGGAYTTPETKAWMEKLQVKLHYCSKDGKQIIR